MERLRSILKSINAKGYKAYKDLKGTYDFGDFRLCVDHVQGDPFAAPSRISVFVPAPMAALPPQLWDSAVRKTALEDFLGRAVARAIRAHVKGRRGIGKSGQIRISTSGQQILVRNAVIVSTQGVEARLTIGLPASGRTVLGRDAEEMFFRELPLVVQKSLYYKNLSATAVQTHVFSSEDQNFLRKWLKEEKLVAFVADNSILPRRSGIDDRPLKERVIPFCTPQSLARTVTLPNRGEIRGMGIPEGVTLIVGGGFHGKSTLLHALERGIYNHIPSDGRQLVATNESAVKIRAEDGRSVSDVNISPFIANLPFDKDTAHFFTENASGSTSQAANIMEALEVGAQVLLIDEDTSATNFMIRDARMQELVTKDKEPITPLLHRVRELYEKHGVSTIIVMGGSGDYLAIADTVIMMDNYRAIDVTVKARCIAETAQVKPELESAPPLDAFSSRKPDPGALSPARGRKEVKIDARDLASLIYGEHDIDLAKVEQLVDVGQVRAIGLLIHTYARRCQEGNTTIIQGLEATLQEVTEKGLDMLAPYKVGDLALPRLYEAAAAINRIRPKQLT